MPVLLSGPAQLYVGSTTAGSAATKWTLIGITSSTVELTRSIGNLAEVITCTGASMAGFGAVWARNGTTADGEPWLPGYNCSPPGLVPPDQATLDTWAREAEAGRHRRAAASVRARELLLSVLTEDEARSYTERGFFELQGSAGGWWRIRRDGQAGNIDELERPGGPRTATWCCHPPGGLPDPDAHLAQLLHLATDEPGFRQTGNRTPRRRLAA